MGRAVIHHNEFSLEEIEAELDAQGYLGLSDNKTEYLRQHGSAMRTHYTARKQKPNAMSTA